MASKPHDPIPNLIRGFGFIILGLIVTSFSSWPPVEPAQPGGFHVQPITPITNLIGTILEVIGVAFILYELAFGRSKVSSASNTKTG